MPRKKVTLTELRVGILAIGSIVILIVFILSVTGDISLFKKRSHYTTHFAAAEGLKAGDEVRLAGKRIGKVERVDFGSVPTGPDDKPIVITMTADRSEVEGRIREDSKAVLAQQGFLGDRVIDITPGTQSKPPLPDGADIPSADQAGLAQVFEGANDILVQFNTVGKQLQELMDNVNQGRGTIGKLLHDDELYVNINRTVLDFQDTTKRLTKGDGTLSRLLNDPKLYDDLRGTTNELQALATDLRAGKGSAGKFLTDDQLYKQATDAVARANSTIERFDRITADLESGHGTIGKLIKDERLHDDLQATVASIRSIGDRLDRGEGTAGKLLHDDKLYNNTTQMSSELVKLMYDFRQNPRKYLSIKVSLF
jgi:phospholipid/cholesterol/gamma-HCH transport system substrate-binding protein